MDCLILINIYIYNFNSIKVRLEQMNGGNAESAATSFQFHKGTIRTDFHGDEVGQRFISIP